MILTFFCLLKFCIFWQHTLQYLVPIPQYPSFAITRLRLSWWYIKYPVQEQSSERISNCLTFSSDTAKLESHISKEFTCFLKLYLPLKRYCLRIFIGNINNLHSCTNLHRLIPFSSKKLNKDTLLYVERFCTLNVSSNLNTKPRIRQIESTCHMHVTKYLLNVSSMPVD